MQQLMLIGACLLSMNLAAQIPISATSLTYHQDFNSLDTVGSNLSTMPQDWSFFEWGGTSVNASYRASTGTATAGDTYSFGLSGSGDRALGSLCSGGVPNVSYGLRFINQTTAYINQVTISYKVEQWRRNGSGNIDSVRFFYSLVPGKIISDTSFGSWIQVPALLMSSVTTAVPASATNGNDTAKVISASIPIPLAVGDVIAFRWHDYNAAGNDDGLAIDSLTISFQIGSQATALKPNILNLSPAPNTLHAPATSDLVITFDRAVVAGTSGSIYVKDRITQLTQTIPANSSQVTVTGRVATISGLGLQADKTYQVSFDSTAFDTAGFRSSGIYDTAAWVFSTYVLRSPTMVRHSGIEWNVVQPGAHGTFYILCRMPKLRTIQVSVHDLNGRRRIQSSYLLEQGDHVISVSGILPPGNYLIRLDDGRRAGFAQAVMR